MDMYMKTLEFLYEYRGDGKLHEIEHLFENFNFNEIRTIVKELEKEGFIELQGRKGIFVAGASLDLDYDQIFEVEEEVERKPYKARIKLKGIQHFEIKIENSERTAVNSKNYHFHAPIQNAQIGDNNSQTNFIEIEKQLNQAISESEVTSEVKNLMLADFEIIKKETDLNKKESKVKKFIQDYLPTIGETTAKILKL